MLRLFKKISWIFLLALGLQTSWGFALIGPTAGYTPTPPTGFGDLWEVEEIGFNPIPATAGAPPFFADPLGIGPKNLGEEYRRNVTVNYYAFNANFLDYFGSNGVVAITNAFYLVNSVLTNVNSFTPALTEFPLNSQSVNYSASAADLLDLKSETMGLLMEQLGLADAVRYVWCLHNRFIPPGATCPTVTYQVVMRNFDITASPLNQVQYSPYINGSLYTYFIYENCDAPGVAPPTADAYEFLVDTTINNPPVAGSLGESALQEGVFYTGLTRDDVAGLRYLYDTNNFNFEAPAAGSVLVNSSGPGGTNYGVPFVLFTSNYTAFALSAMTNDPVTLSNLFPGLIITSSSVNFSVQSTTNYVAYFTNLIGAPAGSQTLVVVPVVTNSLATTYVDTFANLIIPAGSKTNKNSSGLLLTTQVQQLVGAPAGILTTNTTAKKVTLTGVPSGDYYINTNVCGPPLILSTLYTNIVATTNLIASASNTAGLFYSQSVVTYATNHWYVAEPIVCGAVAGSTATNAPGIFQGIGKVQFVMSSFDSLLGQFYQPITNTYSQVLIINSKAVNQTFQRVVTQPDILFTATDQLPGPAAVNTINPPLARGINFDMSNIYPGLAGPGVIANPSTISFNKVGPVFVNQGPGGLWRTNGRPDNIFIWGSFDGSTNAPVVYPDGASITNLINQVLVQITPATLTAGTNGVAYPATTFVATGGAFSPPFTWSLPSGGLPSGLTMSSGGTISGTPTQSGTYDFTVELTDSLSRTVTWSYPLTIN